MSDNYFNVNFRAGSTTKTYKVEAGMEFEVGGKQYKVNEKGQPIDLTTNKVVSDIETSEFGLDCLSATVSMSNSEGRGVLSSKDQEPKKPKIEYKQYTIRSGDTGLDLAIRYHVSTRDIINANPGLNIEKLYENQVIKLPYISEAKYKQYEKDLAAYRDKYYGQLDSIRETREKEKAEAELEARVKKAEDNIKIAKEQSYAKNYNFTVDKATGDVVLTLKKDMKLGDIKDNFRTPKGHLVSKNPTIKDKYKPEPSFSWSEGKRIVDYNDAKIPKGETIRISADAFKPSQGFWSDHFK